jgi:hypothetical protein
MSWRLFAWWIAVKIFSAITFFLSSKLHKPLPHDSKSISSSDDEGDDVTDIQIKDALAGENIIHGLAHM